MTLDNEAQRAMLLQLIAAVSLPGSALKEAHALLLAVETAEIEMVEAGE